MSDRGKSIEEEEEEGIKKSAVSNRGACNLRLESTRRSKSTMTMKTLFAAYKKPKGKKHTSRKSSGREQRQGTRVGCEWQKGYSLPGSYEMVKEGGGEGEGVEWSGVGV